MKTDQKPCCGEAEAGVQVQGQLGLHRNFEASLDKPLPQQTNKETY